MRPDTYLICSKILWLSALFKRKARLLQNICISFVKKCSCQNECLVFLTIPDFYKAKFRAWFGALNITIAQRSRYHWNRHVLKCGYRRLLCQNPTTQTWDMAKIEREKLLKCERYVIREGRGPLCNQHNYTPRQKLQSQTKERHNYRWRYMRETTLYAEISK